MTEGSRLGLHIISSGVEMCFKKSDCLLEIKIAGIKVLEARRQDVEKKSVI